MSVGIGMTLSEARKAQGIELDDAHEVTKIRVRYLQALEDERWDVIPGPAYVRGFLSTYAEFLGLDPVPLLGELDRQQAGIRERQGLPEPIIEPGVLPTPWRVNPRWLALAGVIAVVIALGVILAGGGTQERDSTRRERAEQLRDRAGQTTAKDDPPPTERRSPQRVSLRLRASGDVWVCLVDQRGRELIAAETLSADERRGPFEARRFLLTLGNGQVRLRANGEAIAVPDASEPIGLEIGADGAKDLEAAEGPECA